MSHYRDPLAGLKSQVATKRAALEERMRAEVTPVLRALLPDNLRHTLDELGERALAPGDSMEALADIEGALDAALAACEEAALLAPELREPPDEFPDPATPDMPAPWLIEEPYLLELREAIRARMARLDERALVSRFGDFAYISRFKLAGAPYVFVLKTGRMPEVKESTRHECFLRTSVSRSLPSLVLRRERAHHAVAKVLHIAREIAIGEAGFDERFWITGAERATAVLTPGVRHALEGCARHAPLLEIGGGTATLSWSGFFSHAIADPIPDAALGVVVGIRLALANG